MKNPELKAFLEVIKRLPAEKRRQTFVALYCAEVLEQDLLIVVDGIGWKRGDMYEQFKKDFVLTTEDIHEMKLGPIDAI